MAVKLLGTGLLPTSAATRFRREQDVLARLRHPRIATLLDGGVAEDGTPFLVMERVDGRPIDRFCVEERLGIRRRVELLLQVCEAVAFAHRNLVVHRDLKPGNILVTAEGEVKLLDFGIAKLLEPETDAAEATRARSRLLTPSYAAPEQFAGGAVTTATDVFGLGRVLERLLDGLEVDRDLANIAARALRPEPERRYQDARSLALDLQRWLDGRPVEATPDDWLYRARKALGRHRAAAAAALLVVGVGTAGLLATLAQSAEARRAERAATATAEFLLDLFRANDPAENRGEEVPVREILERGVERTRALEGQPLLRARLLEVLGSVYFGLGQFERAAALWQESLDLLAGAESGGRSQRERAASLRDDLGVALLELGRLDEAGPLLDRALVERRGLLGERHPEVAESLEHLALLAGHRGDDAAAEPLQREVLAIRRDARDGDPARVAGALHDLGVTVTRIGRFPEAEEILREALALHRAALGDDHPDVANSLNALANVIARAGRPQEAAPLMREAMTLRLRLYGDAHPLVAQTFNDLAVLLESQGELAGAADSYQRSLDAYRRLLGADHLAVVIVACNLGELRTLLGQAEAAEDLFREALAALERSGGGNHRQIVIASVGLGAALHAAGRRSEAEERLRGALALARDPVNDAAFVAKAALELGRLELDRGRPHAAEPLLVEAERGYRERYGGDHVRTARAATWLGACRIRLGRAAEGEALLRAALETQRTRLHAGHPHLVATREQLALRLEATGDVAAAAAVRSGASPSPET